MSDPETSYENIQRGVANGWYTCEKLLVDGQPAVRLSGKVTDGKQFTDVYPVSWETYNKL